MSYTDIDKPTDYFNTVLRSGLYGGSDTAFTVGFQPDWIWDKRRSDTSVHALFDSVRGFGSSGKVLYSNTADAEATNGLIDSVSSTGFTIKASADNTGTLVDWCWKKTATAGFDIVAYTGNATNRTISHSCGSAPKMIITKDLAGNNWFVYHESMGNTDMIKLNQTNAKETKAAIWNSTSPTSSVFSLGTDNDANENGNNFIAYCFAEKQGFSKFGSYTGNGNVSGPMIWLGFKPALVIMKETTDSATNWVTYDNKRNSGNPVNLSLYPNLSNAEGDASLDYDFLSNGFKVRTSNGGINASGQNYIYMAFAENPFVTSTGVPATAR